MGRRAGLPPKRLGTDRARGVGEYRPMPFPSRTLHKGVALAAHATELTAGAADAAAPIWIKLLPAGTFSGRDGRGPYVAGDVSAMAAAVDLTRRYHRSTDIVVDYDHQSIFGAIPNVGGRAPAAGWIKELQALPDGIHGRVEWTTAAAAAIRAGEYRYLSPVYRHDRAGKIGVILSAALTNAPNLELPAVAARTDLFTGDTMEPIALALGLAADASEAAILAALGTLTSAHATLAAAAGLSASASTDDIVTAVQSARAAAPDPRRYVPVDQVVAIQSQLAALQKSLAEDKAAEAVNAAMAAGKIAPALRAWAMDYAKADLAGFTAYATAAPVVVVPGGRAPSSPPARGDELSDTDLAVQRAMGLDPGAFAAARKKEGQ